MGIRVIFECGGCDATAEGTSSIRQDFHGITGRPWGFGHHVEDKASDKAPKGWVAFDLIGATYCPKCADDLWPAEDTNPAPSGAHHLNENT